MSPVRPSKPRCATCGHLVAYHRGPRCLGSMKHDVGVFVSTDDRCPCTLSTDQALQPQEAHDG